MRFSIKIKLKVKNIKNQKIITGDSLYVLQKLPDKSIDIVVTSPPYNIGLAYNSYVDKKSKTEYLKWLYRIGKNISRLLKENGSFFLNVGSTNADPWIVFDVAKIFRKLFILQNNIIWVKSIGVNNTTYGNFKPISSHRYLNNNHESILHFTKTGNNKIDRLAVGVPYKYKSNIKRFNVKKDKRCNGNIWFIPYDTVRSKKEKFNHPATFPLKLPETCIKLHGAYKNKTILDPFLGSGTTLVAAENLGMKGIGIEIDPVYVKTATKRLKSL